MLDWTRMPSKWIIKDRMLRSFNPADKAVGIASLMVYSAIVAMANQERNQAFSEIGCTKLSYSEIEELTCLSRKLISQGLLKLEAIGLIEVSRAQKPSIYKIINLDVTSGWAKFPAKWIFNSNVFSKFNLRHKHELNALKLLFLFLAFRDRYKNSTSLSYEKIHEYTNINNNDVCSAISLLVNYQLIQVERSEGAHEGRCNIYRIRGIESRHAGNRPADYSKTHVINEFDMATILGNELPNY